MTKHRIDLTTLSLSHTLSPLCLLCYYSQHMLLLLIYSTATNDDVLGDAESSSVYITVLTDDKP